MAVSEPRYRFEDPYGAQELTRSQILDEYFLWWSVQMKKVGKEDQISEDACVEDWIVVHWAWQVT